AAKGWRIIATLGNQWKDCEGPGAQYKDESWYQVGYRSRPAALPASYRDWIVEVVKRYRDSPTILAWQMMNEAEARFSENGSCGPNAARFLATWAQDVSGLIKAVDPHHLLSLGTIGSGQCGTSGESYVELHRIQEIDLCEYHDYGAPDAALPGDR